MICCGTCIYSYIQVRGSDFSVAECMVDKDRCLTKRPSMELFRTQYGIPFDYQSYSPAADHVVMSYTLPTFTQKQLEHKPVPVCFDCPENRWCGDCPDSPECMETPSDQCGECYLHDECMTSEEVDPELQEKIERHEPLLVFEESQPTKDFIDRDADREEYDGLGPAEAAMLPPETDEEDVVLHPNHYAEADIPSGIECWDWYELAMTEEEVTGHFKGNALKYIFRAGRKGAAVEDLEKARNYLARWIGYLKGDRTVHMRGKKNGSQV